MNKTETAPEKKRARQRRGRGSCWYFMPRSVAFAWLHRADRDGERYDVLGVRLIEVVDEQD